MSADPRDARCPYPGLEAFTADNRQYFVGRERDTQLLIGNLYASPLTVVYGASGVGKTSVILAGAVPEIEREGDAIILVHRTWQDAARARSLSARLAETVATAIGETAMPADGPLDAVAARLAARARRPIFLVFDQFEEYFLYNDPSSADALDGELATLINRRDTGVNVMIALREDSLAALDRFAHRIPGLLNNLYRLEHLTRSEALRAIEEPLNVLAHEAGVRDLPVAIDTGLATTILDDLAALDRTAGSSSDSTRVELPFLQVVLERLWITEARAGSTMLRRATFEQAGRARGIVRQRIEEALNALREGERQIVADVVRHLVTPSGAKIALTMADLRGYAGVTDAEIHAVVDRLVGSDARILRRVSHPSGDGALAKYEIYHDALGAPLLEWRLAMDLLRAERVRRAKWGRRFLITGALVLAVGAVVVAVTLQRGKSRVEARELASTASAQLEADNGRALLLALAAIEKNGNEHSGEVALRRALFEPGERLRDSVRSPIVRLVADPKGRLVVGIDANRHASLWRTDSLTRFSLSVALDSVVDVAFDSSGSHLLVVRAKRVSLLDLRSSQESVIDVPADTTLAASGVVLGTGDRVVVQYSPAGLAEWTRSAAGWSRTESAPVRIVSFPLESSPNQRWLAFTGLTPSMLAGEPVLTMTITTIDLDRRPWALRTIATGGDATAAYVGFASDNHLVVSRGRNVEVITLESGESARSIQLACGAGRIVRAGVEAAVACTTAGFVPITLPDQRSQTRLGGEQPLVNRPDRLEHFDLSRDGRFVLTAGSRDVAPTIWSNFARLELARLRGHRDAVTAAAFLSDSRHVVTAGRDSTIRVWEVVSSSQRVSDGEFMGGTSVAVLNDSATAAAMVGPYGVQIWDLARGVPTLERPVRGPMPVLAMPSAGDRAAVLTREALVEEHMRDSRSETVWGIPGSPPMDEGFSAFRTSHLHYLGPDTMLVAINGGAQGARSSLARIVRRRGSAQPIVAFPSLTRALAIDRGHRFAALARDDGLLDVVDLRTDSVRRVHTFGGGAATAVAFGSEARLAAGGNNGTVVISSPPPRASATLPMVQLGAHDRAVARLAFDRAGQLLASGDEGGTARVWQLDRSRELCSLEGQHADYIRAIAFAPSGRTLATADERGVAIWFIDAAQSACRFAYRLADLESPTVALGFRPDGSALVVVGRDGITRIYRRNVWAPRDSLIALAERRLRGRQLTADETRRYVDRR